MMKDSSVWSSSVASDTNDEMFVEDATVGVTDLEDDDDSDDDCSLEDSYDEEVANVHEFENELQKKTYRKPNLEVILENENSVSSSIKAK